MAAKDTAIAYGTSSFLWRCEEPVQRPCDSRNSLLTIFGRQFAHVHFDAAEAGSHPVVCLATEP